MPGEEQEEGCIGVHCLFVFSPRWHLVGSVSHDTPLQPIIDHNQSWQPRAGCSLSLHHSGDSGVDSLDLNKSVHNSDANGCSLWRAQFQVARRDRGKGDWLIL